MGKKRQNFFYTLILQEISLHARFSHYQKKTKKEKKMTRIALTVLLCGLLPLIQASVQSVGVRGQLKCGNKPLANTVVKLWDLDTRKLLQ
jgi:hypothetical protein